MVSLRNVVAKFFQAFGYEVFHRSKMLPSGLAAHLRALFDVYKVDCVLDVGANEGQYGRFLRQVVGFDGLLVSFEPAAEPYGILAASAAGDANWITFNCALGEQIAEKAFNVMTSSELNSFLDPTSSETTLFDPYNVVTRSEIVQMQTVDSVVAELRRTHGARRIYLKTDTQGYDLQVIAGAAETLRDVVALQTEVSFQRLYAGMPGYLDSLTELHGRGWDLSAFSPIQVDSSYRLIEADCVFVNRSEAHKLPVTLLRAPSLTGV